MIQNTDRQTLFPAIPTGCDPQWHTAAGTLPILMTNDYLFRALLQNNNYVLKGLVCSLLHLPFEAVQSVEITNPILLGEAIDDKDFFLDVSVLLNNRTLINLEMQVLNEHNWPERSLSYLCRTFDNLNSGSDYLTVKPAVQIGILNFTLFPKHPEFYSTYRFMNEKNHTIYSDKIRLSVLNLTHIDLAADEDRKYHLDLWASFFKAVTWEDLNMLAKQDEFIKEASATVYQLSQEEMIRLQCQAREDYYRRQRTVQGLLERQQAALDSLEAKKASLEEENVSLKSETASLREENISLKAKIASLQKKNVSLQEESETL